MSDEMTAAITKTAAARAAEPRTLRLVLTLAVLAIIGAVVLFVLWLTAHQQLADLNGQVAGLNSNLAAVQSGQQAAAAKSQALFDQLKALGKTPVVSAAIPGPGPTGPQGDAGRGITSTTVQGGHLYLEFTDGTTVDAGVVAGTPGAPGVSITGTVIAGGHLVITYSDGHSSDLGSVVGRSGATGDRGPAGRSVSSVVNTDGHLVVTYSDGTTQDAGTLPQGPAGDPPSGFSFTDSLGRDYTCSPDTTPGPGTSPHYSCATPTATPTPGGKP